MKRGFTMIELVFVIIVLGILASVAVPRLVGNRDDAEIVKAKTVVSSVRSGIALKHQELLMGGSNTYPSNLEDDTDSKDVCTSSSKKLFQYVLGQPVVAKSGNAGWTCDGNVYTFTLGSRSATYTYYPTASGDRKKGDFYCTDGDLCDVLDK